MSGENFDPGDGHEIEIQAGELRPQAISGDPNLLRLAAKYPDGGEDERVIMPRNAPSSLESEGTSSVVDLVGRLHDPTVRVPGLTIVRALDDLFTGTAHAGDIGAIAEHENIASIELAKPVLPMLSVSVPEIRASFDQISAVLPDELPVPNGANVVVGIIDSGCDFAHRNFRNSDGSTRLLFLWDQQGGMDQNLSPDGYFYGREFDSTTINAALAATDPYVALSYDPNKAAHGTHVMDIAAGNGSATGNPGVAPSADIIFVDMVGGVAGQDQSFGNSRYLMEATEYIFAKAAELRRDAVINISQGTHGGPHDGSTPTEQWFDRLLQRPGRAIVLSAGNARGHAGHVSGVVRPGTPSVLSWVIPADDPTENELEVWYEGRHRLEVALIRPNGDRLQSVPRGHSLPLSLRNGNEVISIIHNEHLRDNGDNQISILLDEALFAGTTNPETWSVELKAIGADDVPFHAWIERDDVSFSKNQSSFDPTTVDPSHTLSSIACGERTIAVASYMAGEADRRLSGFSSEGPTRDGKQKPDVSAPGQNVASPPALRGVAAAESKTNGVVRMAGTSMAAPHVAGLIALLMELSPGSLTSNDIRQALINNARHNPPSGTTTWDARYGFGRVDAAAVLQAQSTQIMNQR